MSRLGYNRRRGRIKTPPLDADRLAGIPQLLVQMDLAKRAEDAGQAVIVYMDESFVHQAHGSAYSFFPSDEDGVCAGWYGSHNGEGFAYDHGACIHEVGAFGSI